MNLWHFSGRLGRNAELRTTQNGEKVLGFAVANDIGYGQNRSVQWVDCSLWGNRAERLAQYLIKGTEVSVAGELSLREFTRQDGSTDKVLAVRVIEITLHGGQRNGQQTDAGSDTDRPNNHGNGNGGSQGTGRQASHGGNNRQGGYGNQNQGNSRGQSNGAGDAGNWDEIPF